MAGLSVSRLVNVAINLSPLAAQRRSFGVLMVAGDSNVINGLERTRSYTDITSIATDFGLSAPEYLAAALYFSQSPKPANLMIGRWLRTATAGMLIGGILTTAEQSMVNGSRFQIVSATTGVLSIVSFATATTGTDISALLKFTAATASPLVPGYAAETPSACTLALIDKSAAWYGLQFAAATMPTDDQSVDVAALIEAASPARIFGVTTTTTTVLDPLVTTDIASRLKALLYKRSFVQYSANAYAVASYFGRAFSVNFAANRSTITMMYKIEPGIVAETLTETQAQTLTAKRCNVFVNYNNDTAIIQNGVMSGLAYFDEMHGLDWYQDAVQNACYNLLYTSSTKIPQTEDGINQIINVIAGVCNESINNGLVAGGTWNADGFGQLVRGAYLKEGYYIYSQPLSLQAQADREARKAPPIQVALKLAGAVHSIDVLVNVNR
ncbi:MAG: DUF3383 domain-containing protein [Methylococcaceae bacterium]|nr:DUF3383 domain-containing protein [Methylococcaceae bacterium]